MGEGQHIKIVGRGDPRRLGDVGVVEAFLRKVVDLLEMRALGGPHLSDVALDLSKLGVEPVADEGGVTGVIVLSTSHVAIHTWPLRAHFVLDVYSCRTFDSDALVEYVRGYFAAPRMRVTDLSASLALD